MPIYEYECLACGRTIEAFQKFSDAPLIRCQHCQGRLKKLISNTSFQLKGSGWYVTDYARADKGGAKAEKAGKAAEEAKAGKAEKAAKDSK
jgi:putative FmdB family regulatory protein